MVAKLATELPVDPDSLSHCNPACESDKTITPFRMSTKLQARLLEKDFNTLPCNFFCHGSTGSFFHESYGFRLLSTISFRDKKRSGEFMVFYSPISAVANQLSES